MTVVLSILKELRHRWSRRAAAHRAIRLNALWTAKDADRATFYANLVENGDLVFDVGANIGNRTKIFLQLGCRVVAFEPQYWPRCILESSFGSNKCITISPFALGEGTATRTMLVSSAHTISTLAEAWVERTRASMRFAQYEWAGRQLVKMTTLDDMIGRYGTPKFIKIDVEGYEKQVLMGLSQKVEFISIEFTTPEMADETQDALVRLTALGFHEYQVSLGESMEFEFSEWASREKLGDFIAGLPQLSGGDIYAR